MSMVIDQADDGHFDPLGAEERAKYRQNHVTLTGGPPPEGRVPSTEQIAAMVTKLARGDAPYVDFGVFTPHGKRHMKMHKFEAQVFVDNQLVKKQLKGPATFDSWKESWAVFRALMISTVTISSATLDVYLRGIEQLVHQHPNHWGVIFCADEIMRSEIWTSTAEDLYDAGNLPVDMPWDLILRLTSFGGAECTTQANHWWTRHVIWPGQKAVPAAKSYLQEVEGTDLLPFPEGYSAVEFSNPRPRANRTRGGGRRTPVWDQGPYTPPPQGKNGKGKGSNNGKGKGPKGNKGKNAKGDKSKGAKGASEK